MLRSKFEWLKNKLKKKKKGDESEGCDWDG